MKSSYPFGSRTNLELEQLNSVLIGYEELLRPRFVLSDNTNPCLNSSYPTRAYSIITRWGTVPRASIGFGLQFSRIGNSGSPIVVDSHKIEY